MLYALSASREKNNRLTENDARHFLYFIVPCNTAKILLFYFGKHSFQAVRQAEKFYPTRTLADIVPAGASDRQAKRQG
jgi:hypothetical protein